MNNNTMEGGLSMDEYGEKERDMDFKFFLENYDRFYREYGHKFIVIKNKVVLGAYDSVSVAVDITSKAYPLGTFIVQECNGDESGYTNYISSWQLVEV